MSSTGAAGAWSYRTGPWFAAFGPRVAVLLPESQRDQVVGVWSLVDGGAAFDDVLDALLASGLSRLPGFVLVSTEEGPTRVLLRGAGVSATLTTDGDDVVLDGSASGTWVERSVDGVTALSVAIADADPDSEHAETDFGIVTGLVRVARIDRPPYVEPAPAVEESADAPYAAMTGDDLEPAEEAAPLPEMAPAAEPMAEEPMAEEPMAEEPMAPAAEAPLVDEPMAPAAEDGMMAEAAMAEDATSDEVMDAEPAPLDEPAPFEEEAPASDQDAPAMPTGGDPLTDPMPAVPAPPPAPAPAPTGWVTPWDTPPPPAGPQEPATDEGASPTDEPAPFDEPAMADQPATDEPAPFDEPAMSGEAVDDGPETEVMDLSDMPDAPMADEPAAAEPAAPAEPVTEFAPQGFAPPPAGPPPVDLPPPPLPVGSWEPIGSPPPPPAPDPGAAPAAPAAPGAPAGDAVAKLMISDGQQVLVDRVILIGRAPEARRFTSTEQPHLVAVPSRLHEISSTHVEVRPGTGADQGAAVVTDMGSTNGTVLVQPGLGPEDLKPGIAVQLAPGAIINLGDGITIQVTRP